MICGIVFAGAAISAVYTDLSHHPGTPPTSAQLPSPPTGIAAPSPPRVSALSTAGAWYVVVDKHYLDVGTKHDTDNWFYGTVRNDGHKTGDCNVIVYFFDEDDRAIEASVVDIKPLAPGQLTTFKAHPKVENVASGGVGFTGTCGHGRLWHHMP